jgi:serine protease Do
VRTLFLSSLALAGVVAGAVGCQSHTLEQAAGAAPLTASLPALPAPFTTPPTLAGTPDIATLAARVKPSVVNITTTHATKVPKLPFRLPEGVPFGPGFGEGGAETRRETALGSGFIVDPIGHVVTNAHVVEGADTVKVRLADEREFEATVKGKDERLDLAVLELKGAKDLPAASLGESGVLRVGEYVVAIGNPFGLGHTVTMGIVSAKGRAIGAGPYDDFIQTDASINPGNSGGPLFDLHGQVVGINTAINPNGKGIGFAIPVDELKEVLPQLLGTGHVERGKLGAVIQPVDTALAKAMGLGRARGALVAEVEARSPAERAGLAAGDVIVSVDGTEIDHSFELPRVIARHAPGSKVGLRVFRGGAEQKLDVTLSALEGKDAAQADAGEKAGAHGLGIGVVDAPGEGVVVESVAPDSPADGEIRPGDVLLEVDRKPVVSAADVSAKVSRAAKDQPVLIKLKRGTQTRFVAIERR